MRCRFIFAKFFHGNELIEDVIVEHEEQRWVIWVILLTKEALAGIVGLHIAHSGEIDEFLVLLAVGCERYAAVEEHLEVGPYVTDVLLARDVEHTGEDGEHP